MFEEGDGEDGKTGERVGIAIEMVRPLLDLGGNGMGRVIW